MTNYYTADTHFSHARILELCDRPFADTHEMNEKIVSNFNAVAEADDTIYLLGDACMGKLDESLEYIQRINARVILIPGNHDRPSRAYQRKGDIAEKIEKERQRYLDYFDEVWVEPTSGASVFESTITDRGHPVLMSHYPFTGDLHGEERFAHLRPKQTWGEQPIIHGHVHTEWRTRGHQFNVGVDVNDFQLVSEELLQDWVNGRVLVEDLR